MSIDTTRYPRTVHCNGTDVQLRLMTPEDQELVAVFGAALPRHDLLFLRRDITQPKVLSAWASQLEAGEITSLVALTNGSVVGCTAVVRDDHSWSPPCG